MQGQLRKEQLVVNVETTCACCQRPLHLEIDDRLNFGIANGNADPLVFIPDVDFKELEDPSIIDAF